ncbi:condensation domain-containing protein [Micromonospora echinofusca]|uniref:condensation domain-containing protein n=1 Tax=Micromonospora echinofusca TaxID=47858 RepID=UPI003721A598
MGHTVVPLSPAQERLWISTQIRPGDPFFHIPFVIDIDGPLDDALLRACLDQLIRRHVALRARVASRDGRICLSAPPADGSVVDWFRGAVLDVPDEAAAEREIDAIGRAPFDLTVGPPLRLQLIRLDERRHRLAVTVHHLVFDGWSMDLFVAELAALYRAGGDPEQAFSGPPPDYADYLARRDAGRSPDADVEFWSARLAGAPAAIPLPSGRVRPVTTDHAAARYTRVVPAGAVEPLRQLARSRRATMFILLKAACDVVLSHYGGADVLTGVALAGRDHTESHGLIGYLARPVVLRSDLGGDPSFLTLLGAVRGDLLDAHEHPELPFDAVVRALGVPRDPSYNQLYQVMFAYSGERAAHRAGELRLTVTEFAPATMKVDLSVVCTDTPGGLRLDLDYRRDLFAEADLVRIADRMEAVLAQIAVDPTATVSQLRQLSESELRAAVDDPNRPAASPDSGPVALHDLVASVLDRAASTPDVIAVQAAGSTPELTYRGLAAAVAATTGRLVAAGVRPGDPVALCGEPSGALVAALLAVIRMGVRAVLLDPGRHSFELRNAQSEAGFRVVLADAHVARLFDRSRVDVLDMGAVGTPTDDVDAGHGGAAFVAYDDDAEQQAVVLSGDLLSTVLRTLRREVASPPAVVLPLVSSTASISVVIEALLATTAGGTVVPAPPAEAGATLVLAPADGIHRLAGTVPAGAVLVAGHVGAVPPAAVRRLLDEHGLRAVHQVFGPLAAGGLALLDGRPRPGIRAYVLAPDGTPVPPGAVGELFLGGDLIADGYLDEEATAATFRPDPLAGRPGARRFATGRLARLATDGRFEILGDAREPLLRQGLRVDPGPVEDALLEHPGVAAARVLPWRPEHGGPELLALVARTAAAAEPGTLAVHLAARLPGYLRPDRIVVVDALPTDHDDIEQVLAGARTSVDAAEPMAADGQAIAAAWEKVLGRAVPANLNFFEAGGNSLLLIRLRDELRTVLGTEVSLTDLFSHPTIRAMSDALGAPTSAPTNRTTEPVAAPPPAANRGEARRHTHIRRGR